MGWQETLLDQGFNDHAFELFFFNMGDDGDLVGTMEGVGEGAGAGDLALVHERGVQAVEQNGMLHHPGGQFNAGQVRLGGAADVDVEKV